MEIILNKKTFIIKAVFAIWLSAVFTIASCKNDKSALERLDDKFAAHPEYISDGFDFPVGKPDSRGYYVAQKFMQGNRQGTWFHLGEDWNGKGGGNSDLGDRVYAVANGLVVFSRDVEGDWGNVVRIVHRIGSEVSGKYIESVYAHLQTVFVQKGDFVSRGKLIGTIGNVNGLYYAHLHFEMRSEMLMELGGGYSSDSSGYIGPTEFINRHRPGKMSRGKAFKAVR